MKDCMLFVGCLIVLLLISTEEFAPEPIVTDKDNLTLKYELCFAPDRDWENRDLNHFCRVKKQ